MKRLAFFLSASLLQVHAQNYTRGIGVYPGDPKEYTGPTLVADAHSYRNLALHRPAYQSSAYDYNLTAQLITDGIKETCDAAVDRDLDQQRGSLAEELNGKSFWMAMSLPQWTCRAMRHGLNLTLRAAARCRRSTGSISIFARFMAERYRAHGHTRYWVRMMA